MDWRQANAYQTSRRSLRGVRHSIRKEGTQPKQPRVRFQKKGKIRTESVHVNALSTGVDGSVDLVLSRPDPTGTYADGEHVHIEGIDWPADYILAEDVGERVRRAKLVARLNEWVVGHKVQLAAGSVRDDANRLTGHISWNPKVNPSGIEWAKGMSLDEIFERLNLDKYHPPVEKK